MTTQTNLRPDRPFRANLHRAAIRFTAAAIAAGAALGVAASGSFAAPAAAECSPMLPPGVCEPIDIDAVPVPKGPVVFEASKAPGPIVPVDEESIPEGGEKNPNIPAIDDGPGLSQVDDVPDLSVDLFDPATDDDPVVSQVDDVGDLSVDLADDPAVPGPGDVAPENTNQAGGQNCVSITACPEGTTTTTVPDDEVDREDESAVDVLALTGSGSTLLRLGLVFAIGGIVVAVTAASAGRRR